MLTGQFHKYWIIMAVFAIMILFVNVGAVSAHENHKTNASAPVLIMPALTSAPLSSDFVTQIVAGRTFIQQPVSMVSLAKNLEYPASCPSSGSCCHANCPMTTLPGSFRLPAYYALFLAAYPAIAVFPSDNSQGGLIRPPRQG